MQKIVPCLWFDTEAEEAAKFYVSVFKGGKIGRTLTYDAASAEVSGQPEGSLLTVEFEVEGYSFLGLNGGPIFKLTPAMSFFVHCKTADEVDEYWGKLSPGGKALMELGEYPFSKRYGWIQDTYGVSWQVILDTEPSPQKIVPCMLFTQRNFGKAEEAMRFYVSVFGGAVATATKAPPGPPYNNGNALMYGEFTIAGEHLAIMDGPGEHKFTFSEAVSLIVNCNTQEEIDRYWNKLSAVKESEQCGWLKDAYGVSWQITPPLLDEMLRAENKEKAGRAMKAMLGMKKIDIAALQRAYDGK